MAQAQGSQPGRQWLTGPKNILALARLLPRVSPGLSAALGVSVLLSFMIPTVFLAASGRLVGQLAPAVEGGRESAAADAFTRTTILVIVLFVLGQIVPVVHTEVATRLGRLVDIALSRRVLEASLAPSGIAHLEDPAVLNRISLALGLSVGATAGGAIPGLAARYVWRLRSIAACIVLGLNYRWWLAITLFAAATMMQALLREPIRRAIAVMFNQAEELRQALYYRSVALVPAMAKEVRVFGLTRWLGERFESAWQTAMKRVWKERRSGAIRMASSLLLAAPIATIGVVLAGRDAANGQISVGTLVIVLQAMGGIFGSSMGDESAIETGAATVSQVGELERETRRLRETTAGHLPCDGLPQVEIQFDGVSFAYPGSDRPVFDQLDLTIRAGESLALVGRNGAGKTTLIKLLTRQYDPTAGRILIDGRDLREYDPARWQRRVAAIFQDFVRYELPARDNIGFGAVERLADKTALSDAAKRAGALDLVSGLPQAWDTVLFRGYTDGHDLSGGEWQRIALARALFAVLGGAGVLVLDEPTASLDVRSEAEIFDRFLELTQGITSVVISHRFSTVRRAHRICVIENGRVIEDGPHDELIAEDGRYAEMFRLQSARFAAVAWREEGEPWA